MAPAATGRNATQRKTAAPRKAAAASSATAPADAAATKCRLVRDSFTIPEHEYALLAEIKKRCLDAALDIRKTELVRIGIAALADLSVAELSAARARLTPLRAGRPRSK